MITCGYDLAWVGRCKNSPVDGEIFCKEHINKKCVMCGEQAYRECPTASSLLCGAPLCSHCRHDCMGNKGYVREDKIDGL